MFDSPAPIRSNVPEFTVSDLAFSLKRTLEENYARVRVRGELSRVSIPSSGHMYTSLKDSQSVIDAVCWKGTLAKLSVRPEEGLEVICTGRITTYPARSNYQLIIESMELAGEGALLKMLEERRKKLASEGLFDQDKKKRIPFLPEKIGVITSPTGAVIRDIIHRISDRFPRHVLVWPVMVQGEGVESQIAGAIEGFNALPSSERPDVLIVARGGGSLEDLMPFNAESVVRACAASRIPIISAIGHETDTTLIDYAADLRAPTPTGAAEMAVPMRINLLAQIADNEKRLPSGLLRLLSERRHKLDASSARLGNPNQILEIKAQRLDHATDRLSRSFREQLNKRQNTLARYETLLRPPATLLREKIQLCKTSRESLDKGLVRAIDTKKERLIQLSEKLELLSFRNVLKRGYVVVRDENNKPITTPDILRTSQNIVLEYGEDKKRKAQITD